MNAERSPEVDFSAPRLQLLCHLHSLLFKKPAETSINRQPQLMYDTTPKAERQGVLQPPDAQAERDNDVTVRACFELGRFAVTLGVGREYRTFTYDPAAQSIRPGERADELVLDLLVQTQFDDHEC